MNSEKYVLNSPIGKNEIVELRGIPFAIARRDGFLQSFAYSDLRYVDECGIIINETCEALFFLGMVTEKPECSEWWGEYD